MISQIYPRALDCGINPREFWDYSFQEIVDTVESYERRKNRELKKRIVDICDLGYVVTQNINSLFSEKPKTILPWDIYPELFVEEKRISDAQEQKMEFERFKSRRREYAAAHNKRR